MDFSYTEEQQMLRDSIAKFVQNDYDFEGRLHRVKAEEGFSAEFWALFAELGWTAVPFMEEDGGLGGSAIDLMLLMEELGRGIVVEPFLASLVMAGGIVAANGNEQQKERYLPALIAGETQLAFAYAEPQGRFELADVATTATRQGESWVLNGHKAVVLNGPAANTLIVSARTSGARRDREGISLFLVEAGNAGVGKRSYRNQDGSQAAEIVLEDVTVDADALLGAEGNALPAIEQLIDRATLAVCAEAVGAMEVLLSKTVEYAKTREQFGVAIASFQALQHRMAEMFIEVEQSRSIVMMAAMTMDDGEPGVARAVSAAKAKIGRASRRVGQEAVQIHGGIGVTEELDVGHYFKRLTVIELMFGNTAFHTSRFASL